MSPTLQLPSLPLHLAILVSFFFACLPSWSLPPLSYPLQISFTSLEVVREERERGVQNNLLFPEARTSSYCGGHCLGAAPRSEHYSACFNDAQNGGGKESERDYQRWREEGVHGDGRIGLFFSPDSVHPHPLSYLASPSSAQKVHLSLHIHLKRFF